MPQIHFFIGGGLPLRWTCTRVPGILALGLVGAFLGFGCTKKGPENELPIGPNPHVLFHTSKGDFFVELHEDLAPATVRNFLNYVDAGRYDSTLFHRIIPGAIVQGGGFKPGFKKIRLWAAIENEAGNGLRNQVGTLAMARKKDANSAQSQFFLNVRSNTDFDPSPVSAGYAVFGRVVSGMDVVETIARSPTTKKKGHEGVPQEPVLLLRVERAIVSD